jgi:hypothetical protein
MDKYDIGVVSSKIYRVRGVSVMLDRDLADLYCVKPFRLRERVKRNINRFNEFYMFQLSANEVNELVSHFAIPSKRSLGGSLPYVFTEHGTLMLASVLNSDVAIDINQKIIEAFVELRQQISVTSEYSILNERIRRIESEIDSIKTTQKFESKLADGKLSQLSREVIQFSQVLDEFQGNHLIIKRPEAGSLDG